MIALLDSHSLVWAATNTRLLSKTARKVLQDPENDVIVSTISLWELSIKYRLGKLKIDRRTPEDLLTAASDMGFTVQSPTPQECASFHALQNIGHKDPFDRMLIWQCLSNGWSLVSKDRPLKHYEQLGLKLIW
jgi:PIN domain nuclease of toxin-antitoxin system